MIIIQAYLFFSVIHCLSMEISVKEMGQPIFLGGVFQVDYRNISNQARADSRFDIRRARLNLSGHLTPEMNCQLAFEFQGNETRKLVDAFGEYQVYPAVQVRFGQFKMPFSREWQINDGDFSFAERSIGFSLQPGRDIGLMVGGQFFQDTFLYKIGAFNGDGIDGSSRGNQKDDPEVAVHFVVHPFSLTRIPVLSDFFSGISYSEGRIDLTNISVNAKTTGMIGTQRSVYALSANTKFGALLDVNRRQRISLESGFISGPFALYGEYQRYRYIDLKPVQGTSGNANFFSWYTSFIVNFTGTPLTGHSNKFLEKKAQVSSGIWQMALRREYFSGDAHWIIDKAFNAAKEVNAYSLALNYIRSPYYRFLIDYTVSDISDPLRIRVNPDGTIEYMTSETSLIVRFQITI